MCLGMHRCMHGFSVHKIIFAIFFYLLTILNCLTSYIQYRVRVTCLVFAISNNQPYLCDLISISRWCSEIPKPRFLFHCKKRCVIWMKNEPIFWLLFHIQMSLTENFGKVKYSILWLSLPSYPDFSVILSIVLSKS